MYAIEDRVRDRIVNDILPTLSQAHVLSAEHRLELAQRIETYLRQLPRQTWKEPTLVASDQTHDV